jgi:peptide/nickel transport system substrate-binding protein
MTTAPLRALAAVLAATVSFAVAAQGKSLEPPALEAEIKAGTLPPLAKRLPEKPLVVQPTAGTQSGQYGGNLSMLIGRSRDVRMLVV